MPSGSRTNVRRLLDTDIYIQGLLRLSTPWKSKSYEGNSRHAGKEFTDCDVMGKKAHNSQKVWIDEKWSQTTNNI